MNTSHRYQYGSLPRRKRIRTEDVWQFRYYETTQRDALRILERFRLRLNLQSRLGLPVTLDALADDYVKRTAIATLWNPAIASLQLASLDTTALG